MTKRFDRTGRLGELRLHMHSLAGLLHLDYNVQYQIGYEVYFDTIRELGMGQAEVNEAFRRMVFAVATVNFDDHLKNFAEWSGLATEAGLTAGHVEGFRKRLQESCSPLRASTGPPR
jgi:hypothetical protein